MQEPITFLEQDMLDEINAAKSIQVICGKDYALPINLFNFLEVYVGMKFGIIYDTSELNCSELSHALKCLGNIKPRCVDYASATLDRKEADPNLVFLVTIKLTGNERRNAERKFGKMIYIQNCKDLSYNTNCDLTFTNIGCVTMTSKNFANRPCQIETPTTYLNKYLSYDLKRLSEAEEEILSGRSVFFKSNSDLPQKIATKRSFIRKCTQHWLILSSEFNVKDIIWSIMQLIVGDFEGTLTLK